MDKETLVIILTNIDAGRWSKHDVRNFVDRILNHGATTREAVRYVYRTIKLDREYSQWCEEGHQAWKKIEVYMSDGYNLKEAGSMLGLNEKETLSLKHAVEGSII